MTMTRQTDTSWIVEGADVAEYDLNWHNSNVTLTTVERLTATQIVCANGHRYRKDSLRAVGERRSELRQVTDPEVLNVLARERLSTLRYEVDRMWPSASASVANALRALDQIAGAVQAARDEISTPPA